MCFFYPPPPYLPYTPNSPKMVVTCEMKKELQSLFCIQPEPKALKYMYF